MFSITLPDKSIRQFLAPLTVGEVATSIAVSLGKAALAGKVDGKLVDTSYMIDRDVALAIVTDRDADGLEVIRHSTAHLLAYAVKELFPDAQVTIGPVIENGFYYDFSYKRPFTPEDLQAIEKKMAELAKKDEKVTRKVLPRDEAVAYFKSIGEAYKAEIIASIPSDEDVSLYTEGAFTDLCRGPHVPSTGKLKVFKVMKVAGAYWRGDSKNEMLQRIYGTAWAKKEDQEQYLHMLEEAEKRDHRKLGKLLDLFHMQEEAPGLVFWHPKGWTIWQQVEQYMRNVYEDNGYQEIRCPQILDRSLWERSGHWENYKDSMFTTESEKRDYAIKPMNCPGIFKYSIPICVPIVIYRYATVNLAPVIGTNPPARCMASCVCAALYRTTVIFSVPKTRFNKNASISRVCYKKSMPILVLPTSFTGYQHAQKNVSALTTSGTRPKRRLLIRSIAAGLRGKRCRARVRSMVLKLNIH